MDIVHSFEINTTASKVYEAITTESGINGWWSKDCKIAQEAGGVSELKFNKEGNIVEMHFRLDELQPNQKVIWTCVKNPNPTWINTQLTFEMNESSDKVEFKLNHSGWDEKWKGEPPYEMTKDGWKHFMNSIKEYLETGVGQPW